MKKIFYFLGIAALALTVFSCKKDDKKDVDVDNIVEDGVYVMGEATGYTELTGELLMANGRNEAADNAVRDGMFEKYIVLTAGKEFSLTWVNGGAKTKYGANLAAFKPEEISGVYENNPDMEILKGQLVTGDAAPSMKVSETALYHIVLDLNKANDLAFPQIVVAKAEYGVRGGMNGWGYTKMDATAPSNAGMTFSISGQSLSKGGEFKFAYGGAWKITLDAEGAVKANTNLGEGCINGGDNIKVDEAGDYKITLTFKLAKGDISNSWSKTVEMTAASTLPEEMYMIGEGIEGWGLDANPSEAVAMHPFHSQPGMFWAIRYIEAGKGFKFSTINTAWGSDFTDLGNGTGFTVDGGNCFVAESGLYTLQVDYANSKVIIEPAVIVGMAEPFGNPNWDINCETACFTIDGKLAKFTTVAAGSQIRTCVKCTINADWWHAEFIPLNGEIFYREAGGDPEQVAVEAGKVITYDFNAGTGTVE